MTRFQHVFLRLTGLVAGVTLLGLGLFAACGPGGTTCNSDADCKNGFYCALTDSQQNLCVRRPSANTDGGTTTDQTTASPDTNTPPPERRTNPPGDQNNPPPDQNNPPPDQNNPPPDRQPPTQGCTIPPYNAANDPGNGGKQVALDNLDKAFFKKLYEIYYVSQKCHEQVWGGNFKMHQVPTYVVNVGSAMPGTGAGQHGYLINHPRVPSGSTLVDSKLVYGIPNVYRYDAAAKGITQPGFDFGYRVNNVEVYAFEYGTGDDYVNPLKGREAFALFLHEAFHRIQDYEETWRYPSGNQDASGYQFPAESVALALLGEQALYDGVLGKIAPDKALQLYYLVRKRRLAIDKSTGNLVRTLDNFQEWLEGTAMYAEVKYLALIGLPYNTNDPNSIPQRLTYFGLIPPSEPKQTVIGTMFARFYATGAAVGVLLDKLGDTSWKDQIRQGKTFYDIVAARYSKLSDSQQKQLLDQAKQTYNYTGKLLPIGQAYEKKQ